MESWGFFFGEKDEIKVREIMAILGTKDYEKVKAFYLEVVAKN